MTPTASEELRSRCATALKNAAPRAAHLRIFAGFDGFVDEIIHAVDKRENAQSFQRIPTMAQFAQRIAAAAGRSTNIELVTQRTKLGGNGPIMANALAAYGAQVTYLGSLGYPDLHPVFKPFATRAEVHSISEAAHTDALEFDDGKLMLGKTTPLTEITWPVIQQRYGRDLFMKKFATADLVAFANWTMIPFMSDLWASLVDELCPDLDGPRHRIFFDLADPEKRTKADILRALGLIQQFQQHFDVILGLNEKEAYAIGEVLDLGAFGRDVSGLVSLSTAIQERLKLETLVVHPVTYALTVSGKRVDVVAGPTVRKPLITTGAGDHFNAGFCLGKLLGLDNEQSLLCGVGTSGFYVRTAQSPHLDDLINLMNQWPASA